MEKQNNQIANSFIYTQREHGYRLYHARLCTFLLKGQTSPCQGKEIPFDWVAEIACAIIFCHHVLIAPTILVAEVALKSLL